MSDNVSKDNDDKGKSVIRDEFGKHDILLFNYWTSEDVNILNFFKTLTLEGKEHLCFGRVMINLFYLKKFILYINSYTVYNMYLFIQ